MGGDVVEFAGLLDGCVDECLTNECADECEHKGEHESAFVRPGSSYH
jgi:hypothetical protein